MQWLQLVGYVKQCVLQHLEVLNPLFIIIFRQWEHKKPLISCISWLGSNPKPYPITIKLNVSHKLCKSNIYQQNNKVFFFYHCKMLMEKIVMMNHLPPKDVITFWWRWQSSPMQPSFFCNPCGELQTRVKHKKNT